MENSINFIFLETFLNENKIQTRFEGAHRALKASISYYVRLQSTRPRYSDGYADVSGWLEQNSGMGEVERMRRWDSMGVLGLVCRLYREREDDLEEEECSKEKDKNNINVAEKEIDHKIKSKKEDEVIEDENCSLQNFDDFILD